MKNFLLGLFGRGVSMQKIILLTLIALGITISILTESKIGMNICASIMLADALIVIIVKEIQIIKSIKMPN